MLLFLLFQAWYTLNRLSMTLFAGTMYVHSSPPCIMHTYNYKEEHVMYPTHHNIEYKCHQGHNGATATPSPKHSVCHCMQQPSKTSLAISLLVYIDLKVNHLLNLRLYTCRV